MVPRKLLKLTFYLCGNTHTVYKIVENDSQYEAILDAMKNGNEINLGRIAERHYIDSEVYIDTVDVISMNSDEMHFFMEIFGDYLYYKDDSFHNYDVVHKLLNPIKPTERDEDDGCNFQR